MKTVSDKVIEDFNSLHTKIIVICLRNMFAVWIASILSIILNIRMNRLKYHGLLYKDVIYYGEYTPKLTVKNLYFYSLK